MSSRIVFLVVFLAGWTAWVASCGSTPTPERTSKAALVRRGEFLVDFAGCGDCHTPKIFTEKGMEPDKSRLLSGHAEGTQLPAIDPSRIGPNEWLLFNNQLTAAVGPWGISFAANLTSDEETGIGRWNEEAFIATMRSGKHWGVGPQILPPMPWQNLAALPDEELGAIFSYLQSVPPVKNHVPAAMSLDEYAASLEQHGAGARP